MGEDLAIRSAQLSGHLPGLAGLLLSDDLLGGIGVQSGRGEIKCELDTRVNLP